MDQMLLNATIAVIEEIQRSRKIYLTVSSNSKKLAVNHLDGSRTFKSLKTKHTRVEILVLH
ncbi:hypothetical protein X777_11313 [Ooceraea biroi]|uniref:Uncharacterized protein n=1 Tax=Ooceraea biroi TaxID=2015173 RepID=A0A026W2A8_OOCBI|nr:hypothetical protein X777_11313 [Ooceraea biroi]